MPKRMLVPSLLVLIAIVSTTACSDGTSPAGPTPLAPASTATLRGLVEGAASTSSATRLTTSTAAAGLRVSVLGTGLSTLTDATGRFVLSGVPAGRVELRFEGPGFDAKLRIDGLLPGQELEIVVRISGGSVTLVSSPSPSPSPSPTPSPSPSASPSPSPTPSPGGEIEFEGRIESISGTTLVVAGRTVLTDASTVVRRGGRVVPFSELRPGQRIEVEGRRQGAAVLARKITIEDDDDDDEVEFEGRIESISGTTLVVAGRTVLTDASTVVRRGGRVVPFSELRPGQRVEVEGRRQGAAVLARKITIEDDDDDDEVEFKGRIESISGTSLRVAGRHVETNASTRILDDRNRPIPFSALRVGDRVEVEGQKRGASILAKKIKKDD